MKTRNQIAAERRWKKIPAADRAARMRELVKKRWEKTSEDERRKVGASMVRARKKNAKRTKGKKNHTAKNERRAARK